MRKKRKPYISVIIPTLNEEKNLGKALRALKEQEFGEPFEICIGDGHSTDGTVGVALKGKYL